MEQILKLDFETLDTILGDHAPFLISMSDGLQEELRLVIAAAEAGPVGGHIPELNGSDEATKQALHEILADTSPIEINEQCVYEICFHEYILYQIRNESFCSYDPDEVGYGKYMVLFEKSKLLSSLSDITDAQQFEDGTFYPGKWTHYCINTQCHVIDVISHCLPTVSVSSMDAVKT
ncbi:hypothetical protein JQM63_10260 [Oscillibacter valericigenes]|nr:hypothetical protein [Oscillibacter valericigenes]